MTYIDGKPIDRKKVGPKTGVSAKLRQACPMRKRQQQRACSFQLRANAHGRDAPQPSTQPLDDTPLNNPRFDPLLPNCYSLVLTTFSLAMAPARKKRENQFFDVGNEGRFVYTTACDWPNIWQENRLDPP